MIDDPLAVDQLAVGYTKPRKYSVYMPAIGGVQMLAQPSKVTEKVIQNLKYLQPKSILPLATPSNELSTTAALSPSFNPFSIASKFARD